MFVDEVDIHVAAGHGGRGAMSFRREKFVPRGGPNGGDGGPGGSVYLVANANLNTLLNYRFQKDFSAGRGAHGEGSNRTGRSGADVDLEVPVGTVVYERDGETLVQIADLTEDGQRVLVADSLEEGTATNAGAGIIAPGTSVRISPSGLLIGASAVQYYPQLLAELASDGETNTGYATVGSLFVARDEEEAARLPEVQTLMLERRAGGMGNIGEVSLLNGSEAKELFPALSNLPAAIHATGSARVNGRLMRDSLRKGANGFRHELWRARSMRRRWGNDGAYACR